MFDLGGMNSSYGEAWMNRWCGSCYRDKYKCRIFRDALGIGEQKELIYNEEGDPICTTWKSKEDHVVKHRESKDQMVIDL